MSETAVELNLESMPSVVRGFARAAIARKSGLRDGQTIPSIEARLQGVVPNPERLRRYREICGFEAADTLPLTFPHVLAAPMHMTVMTHPQFPLKLVGAVHLRNHIEQKRPLAVDEPLNLRVRVGGHRDVEKGLEFDLYTEVDDAAGERVWTGISTNLVRGRSRGGKQGGKTALPDPQDYTVMDEWQLDAGLGRRYGVQAGDINPIHMHPLLAKLFGFPRAIAHGMWSYARCAAALVPARPEGPVTLDVAFRRPVLLPSTVVFRVDNADSPGAYMLTNPDGRTLHLTGEFRTGT